MSAPKSHGLYDQALAKRRIVMAIALLAVAGGAQAHQQRGIDDFFRDFTAEWVRGNPTGATSSRYFSGDEQDRLERQNNTANVSL